MKKHKVKYLFISILLFSFYNSLGQRHDIANYYLKLAKYHSDHKMPLKAAEFYEKASFAEKACENPRKDTLFFQLYNAGEIYFSVDSISKAIVLLTDAVEICKISFGEDHENYGLITNSLGNKLYRTGDYKRAIELLEISRKNSLKNFQKKPDNHIANLNSLGAIYFSLGNYDKALPLYLEALENTKKAIGTEHPTYGTRLSSLVILYYRMGRYEKALPLSLEALENAEKVLGKKHPTYSTYLDNVASLYRIMGKYEQALPLSLEALENAEKVLGKQHADYGTRLNNLAYLYQSMGRYDNALPLYLEALDNTQKNLGKEHPIYSSRLSNLANLYISMEQYDKALPLYLQAIESVEKSLGKQHVDYGTYLNNLADLYSKMGLYDKSLVLYLEVLGNAEKTLGKQHATYGVYLSNLANLYTGMGQYDKALPLSLEALENAEKALGKQHSTYGTYLNNLASLYTSIGQYDKALPLSLEALENTGKTLGKQHSDYSIRLSLLASLYEKLGQYNKALPFYLEALDNTEKALGKQHSVYGTRLNNLASLYVMIGQYDKALPLFLEALENTEKTLGKQHPNYGIRLNDLADLYVKIGRYDKALVLFPEAIETIEKTLGKQHVTYGHCLNNLANLYVKIGQYEKAIPMFLEALENIEKTVGKQHESYGISLNNLALFYDRIGQYDKALPLYVETLENIEKTVGKQHTYYGISLVNLALLYKRMGQYDKAFSLYLEAIENLKKQINLAFSFLSEEEKGNYVKTVEDNFKVYQSFFTDYSTQNHSVAAPSYEVELLTKGMILSSSQQIRAAIEESSDVNAMRIYEEWFAKKSVLARQYALPISKRSGSLKSWETEAEELEKQLIQLSATFNENIELGKITWQDIQTALQENQVAVEFASFQYRNDKKLTDSTLYTALILKKGFERPVLVSLFEQKQLDSLLIADGSDAARLAQLYRGAEGKSTAKNHKKLYDLIWKPLEAYIHENETIYFAPSGSLHQIAFSAIVTPDGQYLSDKYTLRQVSTTAKLLHTPKAGDLSDISLFGGIDYTTPQQDRLVQARQLKNKVYVSQSLITDLERGNESWNYLPGTLKEINTIKEIAKKTGVSAEHFTGKTALEEHFKQQSGKASPAILHVATHGFFFPNPEKQYKDQLLLLEAEKNVYKLSDNPLNRSGLLFSGANTAWKGEQVIEGLEDGILTAYEASNLSLPNTRLVVLSACETGLGDIKGSEGVFGLQRAFKLAGAEYLLMSLWKVPDTETAEFMEKFYQGLFASKDIEKSYRETQQFMKGKYPKEPYKWAAFVLMK